MDSKQIKTLIDRRHPEYAAALAHWNFCELSYRGGPEYLSSDNIFRYYKEDPSDYADRVARANRANHTKRVIDTVNLHLFKSPPQRDTVKASPKLVQFWEDPVGDGKVNMNKFSKRLDQWLSVYGILYVCVDNTPFVGKTLNEPTSKPYAYLLHPQRMRDIAYDQKGEILWAIVSEDRRDQANPFTSTGKIMTDVRLWTKDAWMLFRQDHGGNEDEDPYILADFGDNSLGRVPIIPVMSEEGTECTAPAMISDIALMDRTLVNYASALDEIIYGQTFSQLAVPVQGLVAGTAAYGTSLAGLRNRVFVYEGADPSNKPSFISPDASQAELIIKAMQVLMRNIYAVTGTDSEANQQSGSKGKEYASGVVREFDYSSIENLMVNKARAIEAAEEKIAQMVMGYFGEKLSDEDARSLVTYPQEFDIRGLEADLGVARQLNEIAAPPELMRAQMYNVADKMLPRQSAQERQDMRGKIDSWQPQTEFDREQKVAETEIKKKQAEKPPPAPGKPTAKAA